MSWFQRLKSGLTKSSSKISEGLKQVFVRKKLDDESLEALEEVLLQADLGLDTTQALIAALRSKKFDDPIDEGKVKDVLAEEIEALLEPVAKALALPEPGQSPSPFVILMVGVNGSGKTTTLGKLANLWKDQGYRVRLAACDTFRAAAVEQLVTWGQRAGVPVVTGKPNSDPAGLAYDALTQAKEADDDLLLIDTAGRLQNKTDLMAELSKIRRVLQKQGDDVPHETLLVLDATVGQNAHTQVEAFNEAAPLTSLIITKLDGTAKAGVVISLAKKHALPIVSIGVGEAIEDLHPFSAKDFSQAILGR